MSAADDYPADRRAADQLAANDPYAFDPAWYVRANPDVAQAGVDPLQHYLQYGMREGRPRNQLEALGGLAPTNVTTGQVARPPETTPSLNPSDPSSWAAFRQQGHAQTQGINRLPNMAPPTDTLSADPLAVRAQFYPHGNNQVYRYPGQADTTAAAGMAAGANGAATPVANLGMGSVFNLPGMR